MAQRKLTRITMQFVKDQLVDERLNYKFDAVAQREDIAAIRWVNRTRRGMPHWLCTPYGKLEVWHGIGLTVERDGAPLVHARSPRAAVFTSVPAAKAGGLVHLMHGFGDAAPYKDGLWWDIKRPTAEHSVQTPDDFAVDPSLSDDHEWGRQRLDRLLKESAATASAADENLVLDLEAVARSWQLPPPPWTKRAHGCFELNTPYGMLVVRRLVGWTVELNGRPLVWAVGSEKVIFDKLEHAKTSGLAHAPDYGDIRFVDGTWWDKRADN
jgi:hypothetical protein